jgi:hypothetical protein
VNEKNDPTYHATLLLEFFKNSLACPEFEAQNRGRGLIQSGLETKHFVNLGMKPIASEGLVIYLGSLQLWTDDYSLRWLRLDPHAVPKRTDSAVYRCVA